MIAPDAVAVLPRGVRLHDDAVRGMRVLLGPERTIQLDAAGDAILSGLDGRTVGALAADLAARFGAPGEAVLADVREFLGGLVDRRLAEIGGRGAAAPRTPCPGRGAPLPGPIRGYLGTEEARDIDGNPVQVGPPIAMLAEVTHRCPLACPYCSNPLELSRASAELEMETWSRVFREAAALGVLQLHLSGGEPASRRDLEGLVAAARDAGLYVNLVTSGIGLTLARLRALEAAGVDHVQLSMQGITAAQADRIGGYAGGFDRKMQVAEWIAEVGFPLTLNAVVHRQNMDDLPAMIDLGERLGARRTEVACVQFHGWAERNRDALMPTEAQARDARRVVDAARARLKGVMVIDFVPPDHHAVHPKACMGGWGSTGLNVAPDGTVLPCHAAQTIPGLVFPNVRETGLAAIWGGSEAFNAFRGTAWMEEPCASCPRKTVDFGGCRCQAMAIAGRARATDPVCTLSPLHAVAMARAEPVAEPEAVPLVYRRMPREAV